MEQKKKKQGKTLYGVARVSSKGQIIIPADMRRDLGIAEGDQLYVMKNRNDDIVMVSMERMEKVLGTVGFRGSIDD